MGKLRCHPPALVEGLPQELGIECSPDVEQVSTRRDQIRAPVWLGEKRRNTLARLSRERAPDTIKHAMDVGTTQSK